ncbi:MAG: hypothetical protein KDA24_14705 [Deltaproteobacteria bacterium]|nr:hypothetical protein [Deltaproteobacteria bacterium]
MADRTLSLPKKLFFGALVGTAVLWALNTAIEYMEAQRLLHTQTAIGTTSLLEESVFVRDGEEWTTSARVENSMVRSRFPVQKAGKRVFITGGSFAQGAPYTYPNQLQEGFGGIPSWLREDLKGHAPPVEVINVAAGGQDSRRVKAIVRELVEMEPDAIVVASCNNESALQPTTLQEQLHRFGTYRLLESLLRPTPTGGQAPAFYQPDSDELREIDAAYESNLREMIEATGERGVPLLLATVPLQLRHGGYEAGSGRAWVPGTWSGDADVDVCIAEGRSLLERGDARAAALRLADCGSHPAARETLEAAYMEVWRSGGTVQDGDHPPGPCVADLVQRFADGAYEQLLVDAAKCTEAPVDALFWSGLAMAELDRTDDAVRTLEQSAELQPQGRCRPSLNATVRRLAKEFGHVHLVDLDEAARLASPRGIPGPELFASNCHLRWSGYWLMSRVIGAQLQSLGLIERLRSESPAALLQSARSRGLGEDPWARSVLETDVAP